MTCWKDINVYKAVPRGRKGWYWMTFGQVCVVEPSLSAIAEGYEVCVITDVCGDVSDAAHNIAVQRMVRLVAKPMTSFQYILELQRDWARSATYKPVTDLIKKYGGGYGLGILYGHGMVQH